MCALSVSEAQQHPVTEISIVYGYPVGAGGDPVKEGSQGVGVPEAG